MGPRRVRGMGLLEGEGLERLWSYLRRLAYITRHMTLQNRLDLLSYALASYARKMINNLGMYTCTS